MLAFKEVIAHPELLQKFPWTLVWGQTVAGRLGGRELRVAREGWEPALSSPAA